MDLLYFEPEVKKSEITIIIYAVRILYPGIRWISGYELDDIAYVTNFNSLIIRDTKSSPKLSWGVFDSKNDLARHTLRNNWEDADIKDGWEHLGLKQDIGSIFDSLGESKLIRKIIKESIENFDEFDWVDTSLSNLSGKRLLNMIDELFQLQGDYDTHKYWLEIEEGVITFWDETGIYIDINENDFSIDRINSDLKTSIENLIDEERDLILINDYIKLAKTLEPIIGPVNFKPIHGVT